MTVIVNAEGKFLQYDGRTWGSTDDQFLVLSEPDAIRLMRNLEDPTLPMYVVKGYGLDCEQWGELRDDGRITWGYGRPAFRGRAATAFEVLAAGPYFGGSRTRPYRTVILRWRRGEYSVHTQYKDDGSVESGSYHGDRYRHAFGRFVAVLADKLGEGEPLDI